MQIMPFEEAKTYRFNPFDLTKVWPHGDYPLHEVGRLTLNRNPTDFHTEIEQAAFEPNNLVPGIGPSPDKMLLARLFSYADAHRARMGVNYKQIPINRPRVPVHSYSKDGVMRVENVSDPVYAPKSKGGPAADPERFPYVEKWGRLTANSSTPLTPCERTTTIGARPARWCARLWTMRRAAVWYPMSSVTSRKACPRRC